MEAFIVLIRSHTLTCSISSNRTTSTTSSLLPRSLPTEEAPPIPYTKQFVLSKPTQYKKLKAEWRSNVYLAKSRIQVSKLWSLNFCIELNFK